MPSKMVGLRRTLTWAEFKGSPTALELQKMQSVANGANGKIVGMAAISSTFTVNFGGKKGDEPVLGSVAGNAQAFALADTIAMTVVFDGQKSWKRIDPLSAKGEQLLLDHEQGHYDITALMARDCFIDVMQLKARTFTSAQAGQTAAKDIVADYKKKLDVAQSTYDSDTTHGAWVVPSFFPERKESFQTKWEGFIQRAFTAPRASGMTAPDGAAYKERLLDVLAAGGFTI